MIWLLIGAIILFFVGWYFMKSANSKTLLEAKISSSDALTYKVTFNELHPDLKPVEYVRMILCFASKMLHIIDPNDPNQTHIQKLILQSIRKLSQTKLTHDTDIMAVCDQEEIIRSTKGEPSKNDKKIVATLYFIDQMQRAINTSLPGRWYEYQFLHSWLALIQESLPKLDDMLLHRLQMSLKKMAELYFEQGVDYSSLNALNNVPNVAFVEAPAK